VDLYIEWPGQALAYKLGQMKIRELRKLAEEELGEAGSATGPGFNIREFHDVVLREGAVPLRQLEERVHLWLYQRTHAPTPERRILKE
jgi:uncharacterized protein (DUF885 family)